MDYFRDDNTKGFDQKTLDAMNVRMVELGADELDQYYDANEIRGLGEKVFSEALLTPISPENPGKEQPCHQTEQKKPNWNDYDNQYDYVQAVIRYNIDCMITGIGEPMPITDQSETRPKNARVWS